MTDAPSRRGFIKQCGIVSAGLVAGTAAKAEGAPCPSAATNPPAHNEIPFYGSHQAGITTPAQKHIYFLVADLHSDDREKIQEMFQMWTAYSLNLTRGEHVKP